MDDPSMSCGPAVSAAAYTEAGQGQTVLLLHGSTGNGTMWRSTMDALRPAFRSIAPDLIGYGRSQAWPPDVLFDLDAEARALQTLLPSCGAEYHLVGYSYGGAVALHIALADPGRVLSLTLIEPVFFAALRYTGESGAYGTLRNEYDRFAATMADGKREAAMEQFVDFWNGSGAWARLRPAVRDSMLGMADKAVLDWEASFAADPGPDRLAALGPLTLLVRGDGCPEPMQRLVEALHALMPESERAVVQGANHLLPLTHSAELTGLIGTRLLTSTQRPCCAKSRQKDLVRFPTGTKTENCSRQCC
ncbi:MAG: alpha/beta fold hydrolase [Rhodomicrobium sp.]